MSASGLSWALERTAEREEDGGTDTRGAGSIFQRPGRSSGKSRAGLVLQLGTAAPAAGAGAAPGTHTPTPAVAAWGTRAVCDGSSHGGLQRGWRGCSRREGPAEEPLLGCGAPDTEPLPTRLRWIAGLTWEIASLPR